jgi:hypothetical protein
MHASSLRLASLALVGLAACAHPPPPHLGYVDPPSQVQVVNDDVARAHGHAIRTLRLSIDAAADDDAAVRALLDSASAAHARYASNVEIVRPRQIDGVASACETTVVPTRTGPTKTQENTTEKECTLQGTGSPVCHDVTKLRTVEHEASWKLEHVEACHAGDTSPSITATIYSGE